MKQEWWEKPLFKSGDYARIIHIHDNNRASRWFAIGDIVKVFAVDEPSHCYDGSYCGAFHAINITGFLGHKGATWYFEPDELELLKP